MNTECDRWGAPFCCCAPCTARHDAKRAVDFTAEGATFPADLYNLIPALPTTNEEN